MSSLLRSILPRASPRAKQKEVIVSAEKADTFECELSVVEPMSPNSSRRNRLARRSVEKKKKFMFSPRRNKNRLQSSKRADSGSSDENSKPKGVRGNKISVNKNLTFSSSQSVASTVDTKPSYYPKRRATSTIEHIRKIDEEPSTVVPEVESTTAIVGRTTEEKTENKDPGESPSSNNQDNKERQLVVEGVLALAESIDKYLEEMTERSLQERDDNSVEAASETQSKTSKKTSRPPVPEDDPSIERAMERIAALSPCAKSTATNRSFCKDPSGGVGCGSSRKSSKTKSSTTSSTKVPSEKSSSRAGKNKKTPGVHHHERLVRIRWRDTSPEVQQRWLRVSLEAIHKARGDDGTSSGIFEFDDDDDDTANRLARGARVVGNGSIEFEANSIMFQHSSHDDMSLSSLDLLFHWLTCREVILQLPENRDQLDPSGMYIEAKSDNKVNSPVSQGRDNPHDVFSFLEDFDGNDGKEFLDGHLESDGDLFDFDEEPGPDEMA